MNTEKAQDMSVLEKITIENKQAIEVLSVNLVNLRNKLSLILPYVKESANEAKKSAVEKNGKDPYVITLQCQVERLRELNGHLEDTLSHLNEIV